MGDLLGNMFGLNMNKSMSSSSASLNNAISVNPIINIGEDNTADSTNKQKGSAEATATAKDEFGMSAGFALGPNSQAQGGPLTRSGDAQPMQKADAKNDNFFADENVLSNINPLYAVGGAILLTGGYFLYKKKKKAK